MIKTMLSALTISLALAVPAAALAAPKTADARLMFTTEDTNVNLAAVGGAHL